MPGQHRQLGPWFLGLIERPLGQKKTCCCSRGICLAEGLPFFCYFRRTASEGDWAVATWAIWVLSCFKDGHCGCVFSDHWHLGDPGALYYVEKHLSLSERNCQNKIVVIHGITPNVFRKMYEIIDTQITSKVDLYFAKLNAFLDLFPKRSL